jgi:glycosyltransferase involved in cell wall biosynthesis
MRVAYFANPVGVHDAKWINHLAQGKEAIVFAAPHDAAKRLTDPSIPVYPVLPGAYPAVKFWERKPTVSAIRAQLKAHKIQLLHSMYAVPNALWADETGTLPHIITTRGSDLLVDYNETYRHPKGLNQQIAYGLMRLNLGLAFQRAVAITCTSERQAEVARKLGGRNANIQLVRTGVDVGFYALMERQFNQSNPEHHESSLLSGLPEVRSRVRIFCPRSMKPLYNLHLLVEAFARIKDELPDTHLVLVNDIPESDYARKIQRLIQENGLTERVTLLPAQNAEGMAKQYYQADLVVMIPSSDGTPVTAIEAMLLRRPVVLSALDYDKDLFDAESCWQVPALNADSVAAFLRHLLLEESTRSFNAKVLEGYLRAVKLANRKVEMDKVLALYQTYARKS